MSALKIRDRSALVFILALLATGLPLWAQSPSGIPADRIDEVVSTAMREQEAVGAAIGLIRNNRIILLKGYGYADRENELRTDRSTLFRWASLSKCLTAVAAMQLVEQGRLDLDADVRKLVPEFPDKGARITQGMLLSHLGGIVHYSNGPVVRTEVAYVSPHPFEDVIVALDTFRESPLIAAPGEKYSYTTHGFILASAVVQRAGKEKFADQVGNRIALPLEMTTLQPDYQWIDIPNRAAGYLKRDGAVVRSTDTDVSWKLGGGGFLSNIDDLAKFAVGLLDDRLVSRATRNRMWERQKTRSGETIRYALGFFVSGEGDDLRVYHGGSQEKTRTNLEIHPNRGTGVVVMCNSRHVDPRKISDALFPFLE